MLSQRLGVANWIESPDLLQKVEPFLLPSTLNPNWGIFLVERRCIYMPET